MSGLLRGEIYLTAEIITGLLVAEVILRLKIPDLIMKRFVPKNIPPVTALAVMTDPDVACAAEAWVFSIGELSESASADAGSSLAGITFSSLSV